MAEKYLSLCKVISLETGQKWLIRMADIQGDVLVLPDINDKAPQTFYNRRRLYYNDGPDTDGAFGVWEWSAVPKLNDPSKDYVETKYLDGVDVTEIIHVSGVSAVEDVVKWLKAGIVAQTVCRKVLLCPRRNRTSSYEGVLCTEKDASMHDGMLSINETVPSLPVYSLMAADELEVDGKIFCRNISFGAPIRRVMLKSIGNIIRDAVRRKISWSAAKSIGIQRKDWQKIADFIENLRDQTIIQEVAEICGCTEETAGQYIRRFIDEAGKYISYEDYDTGILTEIVENNASLMKKCTDIVAAKIQADIKAAREKLDSILALIAEKQEVLPVLEAKLSALKDDIQEQERLASEVSENVRKRISAARSDAAGFIAEMAFARPEAFRTSERFIAMGSETGREGIKSVADWRNLLGVIDDNLAEAGVSEKYSAEFAVFMYSAYVHNIPLLLAGPNSADIADAFSAAVSGRTAGIIDCSGKYYAGLGEEIAACSDEVLALKNALRNEWLEHIPEIIAGSKYFLVVHPYAEDLLIEPKSLFSYVMPVFTELITVKNSSGRYRAGARTENFTEYDIKDRKMLHNAMMKSIGLSRFTRCRLQSVLTDFRAMSHQENNDTECLFVLYPYAYIYGAPAVNEVLENLSISHDLKDELKGFAGVKS